MTYLIDCIDKRHGRYYRLRREDGSVIEQVEAQFGSIDSMNNEDIQYVFDLFPTSRLFILSKTARHRGMLRVEAI